MTHSPAPWTVDGVEVFDANHMHVVWELGDRNEANQRLIAAAPDMLAALKLLIDKSIILEECGDTVRAAIAKAEGR